MSEKREYTFEVRGSFRVIAATDEEAEEKANAVQDHIEAHMTVDEVELTDVNQVDPT